ncbi:hypothetical protein Tco_0969564 [Tanacetum coccineum]
MRLLPGRVVRIFACVSKFDAFEDHSLRNCRGNYMDEVCSICCVKAGNSFVNDPNSNSSNDSPNPFSNNPPTTPVVLVGYVEMILTLVKCSTTVPASPPVLPPGADDFLNWGSLLEEFAGKLVHIDLISPEINEANFDPEKDLDALKDHFEIFFDDCTSSDDDYGEDIYYVEASTPDSELVSLEEIESLNDYPTPSTDFVLKSPSSVPIPVEDSDFFLEKSKTFLSLPELKTFRFDIEEKNSGSTIFC